MFEQGRPLARGLSQWKSEYAEERKASPGESPFASGDLVRGWGAMRGDGRVWPFGCEAGFSHVVEYLRRRVAEMEAAGRLKNDAARSGEGWLPEAFVEYMFTRAPDEAAYAYMYADPEFLVD